MKVGDLVNVTEQRGSGTFYDELDLGHGIVVHIEKTDDISIGTFGPINLGDSVTVLLNSGKVRSFNERGIEVIHN